ncbi:YjgN family protein [Sinorhizobium garamanticum]|uniref:YjgN family protein n=1 Tax=Sinorhizobium garamanticum TaxID=680247 RepID=A0ABY8DAZ2_9HYPH|nr:YjgN family protein [Sinorhizobium garamanticum]WEX88054.1 YjgN family protein [Sinorhizobium garamanticum]
MTLAEPLSAQTVGQGSFGRSADRDFQRLSFSGSASEYFGIWVVNILLTILTLGIYSAWAKVRRNRYFYGNTVLLGRAFEYHARGWQILIGRLIVFAYLVLYNVMLTFVPLVGIALSVLLLFFVPWLLARGLRFSARVTSYRNVRFDFVGRAGGAFVAFIVGPVLAALTLGILAPLASRWSYRYIGNNLRYGRKAFATDPSVGQIYRNWAISAAIIVLGFLIVGFVVALNSALIATAIENPDFAEMVEMQASLTLLIVLGYVLILSIFGVAGLVYRAGVRNVAWSATTFDGRHRLLSDLSRLRYTWIAVSNFVVTLVTLGLMRPWAAVRMARYVNEHTAVRFDGNVGEILSAIEAEGSAVGAEFMDIEGFDFGF